MFTFNVYSSLLIPGVFQGVLFAVLLFVRSFRESRLSDTLLACILIIYSIRVSNWMLGFAGWYDSHDALSTFMFYFPFSHMLALGPLVYFYFLSLTNHDFTFEKKHLLHAVPQLLYLIRYAIVFAVDVLYRYYGLGEPFPEHFGTQGKLACYGVPVIDEIFNWAAVVLVVVYLGLTLAQYRKYQRYLYDHFSDTEKLDFSWLRNMLVAVLAGYLIWLIFQGMAYFIPGSLNYVQAWYAYFGWALLIYYFSIAGYTIGGRSTDQLEFKPEPLPMEPVLQVTPPDAQALESEVKQLQAMMTTYKPYLDPELTLAELGKVTNLQPPVLSRTINVGLGLNFNDFINGYRVDAVKVMMADPAQKHLSLLGIALTCGFNSKATFNRAFRKLTGVSPSEYLKNADQHPVEAS